MYQMCRFFILFLHALLLQLLASSLASSSGPSASPFSYYPLPLSPTDPWYHRISFSTHMIQWGEVGRPSWMSYAPATSSFRFDCPHDSLRACSRMMYARIQPWLRKRRKNDKMEGRRTLAYEGLTDWAADAVLIIDYLIIVRAKQILPILRIHVW